MISPSSGPSRVGFAARAPRGYALDCPSGRRVEPVRVSPKKMYLRFKSEGATHIIRGTNFGGISEALREDRKTMEAELRRQGRKIERLQQEQLRSARRWAEEATSE